MQLMSPHEPLLVNLCHCGSGRKFKHCHGVLAATPAAGVAAGSPELIAAAAEKFHKRNLAQAEFLCWRVLDRTPDDPSALALLGDVAVEIGAFHAAQRYYEQALRAAPSFAAALAGNARARGGLDRTAVKRAGRRYLLIKAWGYGFWSDVHHVVGQLLLAELTGRIPVVHWGRNSLFRSPQHENAFESYFEPVSGETIVGLANPAFTFFPPKWNCGNLLEEDVSKWAGAHSRAAAIYFLNRDEDVAVSDFHTGAHELIPWIEPESPYAGLEPADLYRQLFATYIRLRPHIADKIDAFWQQRMRGKKWLAVHVRGSDKLRELPALELHNRECLAYVDRVLRADASLSVFLLTDSQPILDEYRRRHGERLLCTDCIRVSGEIGVHNAGHAGWQVAQEVIMDAYLAARCDYFVGNGGSNVSTTIVHLKNWSPDTCALTGKEFAYQRNPVLNDW